MATTRGWDSSLAFLQAPYTFVGDRCQALRTNVFETRLMLQKTVCMRGRAAAQVFYDPELFERSGASFSWLQATPVGKGSPQGVDGEPHDRRARLFASLLAPSGIERLRELVAEEWAVSADEWEKRDSIRLDEEFHSLLTRAVCVWAGIPLSEFEVERRSADLVALFDQAAVVGPGHMRSRLARRRAEAWLMRLVRAERAGRAAFVPGSVAARLTREDLDVRAAAVELLNFVRPIVAVSVYMVFVAHALHQNPEAQPRGPEATERFVQEVRRFYPFAPAVAARVKRDFDWAGIRFAKGRRVLLDLYGTNHDPSFWSHPERFQPGRFLFWNQDPFSFIPQSAGDPRVHNCSPVEAIALSLMKETVAQLTDLRFEVPPQDTGLDMWRLPALPHAHLVVSHVRVAPTEAPVHETQGTPTSPESEIFYKLPGGGRRRVG